MVASSSCLLFLSDYQSAQPTINLKSFPKLIESAWFALQVVFFPGFTHVFDRTTYGVLLFQAFFFMVKS